MKLADLYNDEDRDHLVSLLVSASLYDSGVRQFMRVCAGLCDKRCNDFNDTARSIADPVVKADMAARAAVWHRMANELKKRSFGKVE